MEILLNDLELDLPENEEIYESGVSLDELLEVYRRMKELHANRPNLVDEYEEKEEEDLEKLDYGEDQRNDPQTRRNPYQLREGRLVGFTANMRNLNLVIYKRDERESNQWWAIRAMIK